MWITHGGQGKLWARTGGNWRRRGDALDLSWTSWAGPQKVGRRRTCERSARGKAGSRGEQACPGVRAAGVAAEDRREAQESGSRNLKPQGCFLLDGGIQTFASYSKSSSFSCETQGWKKVSLGELYVCSRLLAISLGVLDQFTHLLCAPGLLG